MRITLALILCATFPPAVAQTQCGSVADVLAGLAATYGETVRVSALMTGGDVMIIDLGVGHGVSPLRAASISRS